MLGVVTLRDMMDTNMLEAIRAALGFELLGKPDRQLMVYDFIQACDPSWVRKPFFAEFDEGAVWFDDLRPAFGKERFYFEEPGEHRESPLLLELTEILLE